jgi:hypothetical protein
VQKIGLALDYALGGTDGLQARRADGVGRWLRNETRKRLRGGGKAGHMREVSIGLEHERLRRLNGPVRRGRSARRRSYATRLGEPVGPAQERRGRGNVIRAAPSRASWPCGFVASTTSLPRSSAAVVSSRLWSVLLSGMSPSPEEQPRSSVGRRHWTPSRGRGASVERLLAALRAKRSEAWFQALVEQDLVERRAERARMCGPVTLMAPPLSGPN